MQLVNYLLVSAAFTVAGYAGVLSQSATAAGAIAIVGVVIAGGFAVLDERTKGLVKAAEAALVPLQRALADRVAVPS